MPAERDGSGDMAEKDSAEQARMRLEIADCSGRLAELEKSYRLIRTNVKRTKKRQGREYSKLYGEKKFLSHEIPILDSPAQGRVDKRLSGGLMKYDRAAITNKTESVKLAEEIIEMDKLIADLKKRNVKAKGNYELLQSSESMRKQYLHRDKMENKVHTYMVRINKVVTENGQCRELLYHLINEKRKFLVWIKERENKVGDIHRELERVQRKATVTFDERDSMLEQLNALKTRNRHEKKAFYTDYIRLKIVVDEASNLVKFMDTKGDPRQKLRSEEKDKKEAIRKMRGSGLFTPELVEACDYSCQRVVQITGEDVVTGIMAIFDNIEVKRTALFNYVNELNSVSKRVRDDAIELETKKNNIINGGKARKQKTENEKIEISKQIKEIRQFKTAFQAKKDENDYYMKEVSNIVTALLNVVNISKDEVPWSSFDEDITQKNLLDYMKIIESFVNDLMEMAMYKDQRVGHESPTGSETHDNVGLPVILNKQIIPSVSHTEKRIEKMKIFNVLPYDELYHLAEDTIANSKYYTQNKTLKLLQGLKSPTTPLSHRPENDAYSKVPSPTKNDLDEHQGKNSQNVKNEEDLISKQNKENIEKGEVGYQSQNNRMEDGLFADSHSNMQLDNAEVSSVSLNMRNRDDDDN